MTAAPPTSDLAPLFAAAPEGSVLVLPPGRHSLRAPLVLSRSLRVRGADDGTTVLDAGGKCALFTLLGEGRTYTFETLTFHGGGGRFGGAVAAPNRNVVGFEGCRFGHNAARIAGGAISIHRARGYLRRCIFENNAALCGGALAIGTGCDVTVDRCVFVGNEADAGGAILLEDDGALEIRSATFVRNRARREKRGNAVYVAGCGESGPSGFFANAIFNEVEALATDDLGGGTVFLSHSIIPRLVFAVRGVKNAGGNVLGPAELIERGGGVWGPPVGSSLIGLGDPTRIAPGAVDVVGAPLVREGLASPGAVAAATKDLAR